MMKINRQGNKMAFVCTQYQIDHSTYYIVLGYLVMLTRLALYLVT